MRLLIKDIKLTDEQKAELIKQDRKIFNELQVEFSKEYLDETIKANAKIVNEETAEVEARNFYTFLYYKEEEEKNYEWVRYDITYKVIEQVIQKNEYNIDSILEKVRNAIQESKNFERQKAEKEQRIQKLKEEIKRIGEEKGICKTFTSSWIDLINGETLYYHDDEEKARQTLEKLKQMNEKEIIKQTYEEQIKWYEKRTEELKKEIEILKDIVKKKISEEEVEEEETEETELTEKEKAFLRANVFDC
jgi:hypothetical protein